jgi:hypothetical protein
LAVRGLGPWEGARLAAVAWQKKEGEQTPAGGRKKNVVPSPTWLAGAAPFQWLVEPCQPAQRRLPAAVHAAALGGEGGQRQGSTGNCFSSLSLENFPTMAATWWEPTHVFDKIDPKDKFRDSSERG